MADNLESLRAEEIEKRGQVAERLEGVLVLMRDLISEWRRQNNYVSWHMSRCNFKLDDMNGILYSKAKECGYNDSVL